MDLFFTFFLGGGFGGIGWVGLGFDGGWWGWLLVDVDVDVDALVYVGLRGGYFGGRGWAFWGRERGAVLNVGFLADACINCGGGGALGESADGESERWGASLSQEGSIKFGGTVSVGVYGRFSSIAIMSSSRMFET